MKILVVCQYYYPENFQITPICEQLVKDGYDVTVITGLPNYPTGIVPEEYKNKDNWVEDLNGVHVIRCYEIGRKTGAFFLALNYLSFYLSSMIKVHKIKQKFDCVFVYQLSPVIMGLPGRYYAKKYKLPLYLYCCDIWPESMKMYIKSEKNILFKMVKRISKRVYEACDVISVQSKTFIDYFVSEHDIDVKKIKYIPAFSNDVYLQKEYNLDNGIIDFVFLGNIGIAQNLELVIEAVDKIKEYDFIFHIVGDGSCLNKIKRLVEIKGLEKKVVFYGRCPVDEMEHFYSLADACLVSLKADNKTGLTLPSKVQGYMAAGKPIIGMIDGAAYDVINEAWCGVCVPAGDIEALSRAMEDFIINPHKYKECGNNGRKYFVDNFKQSKVVSQIERIFDDIERK